MLLDTIHSRQDLLDIPEAQLGTLCDEIRQFLVKSVSRTGGHLASNLGIVETTVAIHRVFDTSRDRLVFDVGHQCYVHKMLTGRMDRFDTLRQQGGLSGFPKPCESEHDAFIAGHASNAVSVALGMARARTMEGADYHVLALMGDGALTGGLAGRGCDQLQLCAYEAQPDPLWSGWNRKDPSGHCSGRCSLRGWLGDQVLYCCVSGHQVG